jgi:hypothetical protein
MSTTRSRSLYAAAMVLCLTGTTAACTKAADSPAPEPGIETTAAAAPSKPVPTPAEPSKEPTTDPLTGGRRSGNEVFAVKIENTAAARPQVGLNQADIVVVEEVEAKITRLIGVFHTTFPTRVGPVRSARNTDAQLLPMFGKPGLVYSGANRKVQKNLRTASLVPIERSDRDSARLAPHNVMVNLKRLAESHKVGRAQQFGFTFAAKDARWTSAESAGSVKVKVGMDTTTFGYRNGRYAVSWNGRPNVDGDSRKPVRTDNVIVLAVKNRHDSDSTSNISVVSETVGKGKVTVYRDGRRLTGTWSRTTVHGAMTLTDSNGEAIPLKPGRSWVLLQG